MRLTPLDIRKQEFTRAFRGFDAEEVQAFLSMLSNQWEEVIDESRRKEERIRELVSKLEHYEKVEEALQEALHTARETSRKALENAEQKAQLIVERAEHRAEDIKRDAEHERHQIKRETAKLSSRRSEIVTRLRAFLMSEMEMLARFEGDDPVGFIKLLPAEEHRLHQLTTDLDRERERRESAEEPTLHIPQERDEEAAPEYSESGERVAWNEEVYSEEEPEEYSSESEYLETDMPGEQGTGREEEVLSGPGWTARSVISRPAGGGMEEEPEEGELDEGSRRRVSSDEIEKIRRILSDLD